MKDTTEIRVCPACGKEMHKIYISSVKCNLDVCLDGCGGIYFDNLEFKKVDEGHEDISELIEALEGREFVKVDESQTRYCPSCGAPMVKNFASAKHEVEVDTCYSCGGIFLDGGELLKIRSQFKTEADRAAHFNKMFMDNFSSEMGPLDETTKARVQRIESIGRLFIR